MNVMAPTHPSGQAAPGLRLAAGRLTAEAATGGRVAEDLMTRRQVASVFGVTSATVASWARRGRLPELRNEAGRPRYRRADVAALFRDGVRQRP